MKPRTLITAILMSTVSGTFAMQLTQCTEPKNTESNEAKQVLVDTGTNAHSTVTRAQSSDNKTSSSAATPDERKHYQEISHPTPNYNPDRINTVEGVILHHTAEPTIERSLAVLTSKQKGVGTHCVIDTDGTRYIMCAPEVVTFHAGLSVLNGRVGCNNFTIGIEFQGNTLEKPLTEDQIESAIEYLLPLIDKYNIPIDNIVSHKMVRDAYKKRYPNKRCAGKVDITDTEYQRFMKRLKQVLKDASDNKD